VKPLYILVEGQTEEEFVKENLISFFVEREIYDVRPIKISTKVGYKGGFVNYDHLKRDATKLLKERREIVLSTFVDYFRVPNNLPEFDECGRIADIDRKIECLEEAMKKDIGDARFFPYIQKHEFEALLFSSNEGFESYYGREVSKETAKIIEAFPNPEEINDKPQTAPSKRLLKIIPTYNKVLEGNILALQVTLEQMLEKCPRFNGWIEGLIDLCGE
jgi:hypothetical protein